MGGSLTLHYLSPSPCTRHLQSAVRNHHQEPHNVLAWHSQALLFLEVEICVLPLPFC